jgi:sugar phosphate isomerase/epimerase
LHRNQEKERSTYVDKRCRRHQTLVTIAKRKALFVYNLSDIDLSSKLAVQMYTVRDYTKTRVDFDKSLKTIRSIGYTAVQLSAVGAMNGETPEVSPTLARQMLDDNGLKCIATHRSWDDLTQNTEREINFHKIIGCDYTAIGGIPAAYGDNGAEGYEQWLLDAVPVIQALKSDGISFGYHNHAFEFQRTPSGGTLYDILVNNGGPDLMLEMDVYWVDHAGVNPVRVIERAHGRLPVIHIKDKEMVGSEPMMAPIGEGNLDWPELLAALNTAQVEWYAIEQDVCRRDPFDCLRSSFNYLVSR